MNTDYIERLFLETYLQTEKERLTQEFPKYAGELEEIISEGLDRAQDKTRKANLGEEIEKIYGNPRDLPIEVEIAAIKDIGERMEPYIADSMIDLYKIKPLQEKKDDANYAGRIAEAAKYDFRVSEAQELFGKYLDQRAKEMHHRGEEPGDILASFPRVYSDFCALIGLPQDKF